MVFAKLKSDSKGRWSSGHHQNNAKPDAFNMLVSLAIDGRPPSKNVDLYCEKVLRTIPGRRTVYQGKWDGKPVAIKCFFGSRADRHLKRELAGWSILEDLEIRSPQVLGDFAILDRVTGKKVGLGLLVEWLVDAEPAMLGDGIILQKIIGMLSKAHSRGVKFLDPHSGNYLINKRQDLYLVDGDSIRKTGRLTIRQKAKNLALVLAQFPGPSSALISRACRVYENAEGSTDLGRIFENRVTKLERSARRKITRSYLKKTLRESSRFSKLYLRNGSARLLTLRDYPLDFFEEFSADPELIFSKGEVIKAGGSSIVSRVQLADQSLVIKKYKNKTRWKKIKRHMQVYPRWRRAWSFGHLFEAIGIPVPRMLALLEVKSGWVGSIAYLVMQDTGIDNLLDVADANRVSRADIEGVVGLLRLMRDHGFVHGDLKATNIMVSETTVFLLDLDSVKISSANKKDIQRFLGNWEHEHELSAKFLEELLSAGLLVKD